ncbi:MAG TPA: hypothetical protein VFV92_05640 [Candidatus Bathyarchaeia archaeon]|nr:hypothetical protein [Candidatus Bathyarchaeia archaeon]
MDQLESQWYAAASLLIQAGFLMAAVWSVRAILKTIRASQQQMGALLRLTLSGANVEDNVKGIVRPTPYLLDGWPEIPENPATPVITNKETEVPRRGVWGGLVGWLQMPMASSEIGSWRRVVRWLQAPASSRP